MGGGTRQLSGEAKACGGRSGALVPERMQSEMERGGFARGKEEVEEGSGPYPGTCGPCDRTGPPNSKGPKILGIHLI